MVALTGWSAMRSQTNDLINHVCRTDLVKSDRRTAMATAARMALGLTSSGIIPQAPDSKK
jgi:hypothetical protein